MKLPPPPYRDKGTPKRKVSPVDGLAWPPLPKTRRGAPRRDLYWRFDVIRHALWLRRQRPDLSMRAALTEALAEAPPSRSEAILKSCEADYRRYRSYFDRCGAATWDVRQQRLARWMRLLREAK